MGANDTLVRRWFEEVWNQGRADAIDRYLHPEARFYGLAPEPMGREEFKAFHRDFNAAFEIRVEVTRSVEEGEGISSWCVCTVTHRASGQPACFEGAVIGTIRDGLIHEGWNAFDFLGLLTQLGMVPETAMAEALAPPPSPPASSSS